MINYMVDSENVGTKWIPYLKENIKKTDRVFLFYTDKSNYPLWQAEWSYIIYPPDTVYPLL